VYNITLDIKEFILTILFLKLKQLVAIWATVKKTHSILVIKS